MFHRLLSVAALVVSAAPAVAQDTKALELVPHDALGFILVKDLRQLSDHVENAAKQLGAEDRASLLEMIQTQIGIRDGLNDRGSAIFLVLAGKSEKSTPAWILAVAVSDYGKVATQLEVKQPKDGINEGQMGAQSPWLAGIGLRPDEKTKKSRVLVARRDDFVLLALPEDRDALQRVLDPKTSAATAVAQAREWLAEQDIGGVCTNLGIKQVGLALVGAGTGSSTSGQADRMKETFAEVEKNVKLIAFGGRIEKPGHWRLSTRLYFDPQGSYAKWVAGAPPADGTSLAALPDDPYLLAGAARISAQTNFEGAIRLLTGSLPDDAANRLTKDTVRLVQRVSEVGLALYVDPKKAAPMKGHNLAFEAGVVARVDDAPAFVTGAVDLVKQVREATKDKDEGEVSFRQKKLGGRPGWVISTVEKKGAPIDGKPPSPGQGMTLVLVELTPQTVFAAATEDADRAEGLVKRVADGGGRALGNNPGVRKTAALLPPACQLAAYLDLRQLGHAFSLSGIPDNPAECPPAGFAIRALPAGVEAQFVIPFETIQAVFKPVSAEKKVEPKKK